MDTRSDSKLKRFRALFSRKANTPETSEPITSEPITTEAITTEAITLEPITPEPITSEPIDSDPSPGPEVERFRALVIGRANAGKTTILKAICGSEIDPRVSARNVLKLTSDLFPRRSSLLQT
jgi:ribosome biogenesis GTPase A